MMKKLLILPLMLLLLAGCYDDKYDKLYPAAPATTCDTTTIAYARDIAPIIMSKCYSPGNGCHDAAGATSPSYDFQTSITNLQNYANSGRLLGDLNWESGFSPMPKNSTKLPDCDINKIARWVHLGALNN